MLARVLQFLCVPLGAVAFKSCPAIFLEIIEWLCGPLVSICFTFVDRGFDTPQQAQAKAEEVLKNLDEEPHAYLSTGSFINNG